MYPIVPIKKLQERFPEHFRTEMERLPQNKCKKVGYMLHGSPNQGRETLLYKVNPFGDFPQNEKCELIEFNMSDLEALQYLSCRYNGLSHLESLDNVDFI